MLFCKDCAPFEIPTWNLQVCSDKNLMSLNKQTIYLILYSFSPSFIVSQLKVQTLSIPFQILSIPNQTGCN